MTTAEHEAAHLTACLLLGVPVLAVDTVGDSRYAGWVTHGVAYDTAEGAVKHAVVLLAPYVLDGDEPRFPPDLAECKDLYDLARLVNRWGWGRQKWDDLLAKTLRFVSSDEFWSTYSQVLGVLDHYPRLDDRLLDALERSLASGRG